MSEKVLLEEVLSTLNECVAFGIRPDEYQHRHNLLIRQLAAYVLYNDIENLKENDE